MLKNSNLLRSGDFELLVMGLDGVRIRCNEFCAVGCEFVSSMVTI